MRTKQVQEELHFNQRLRPEPVDFAEIWCFPAKMHKTKRSQASKKAITQVLHQRQLRIAGY